MNDSTDRPAPGSGFVPAWGNVALAVYLAGLTALLLYCFVALWPETTDQNRTVPTPTPTKHAQSAKSSEHPTQAQDQTPRREPSTSTIGAVSDGRTPTQPPTSTPTPTPTATPVRDPLPVKLFAWHIDMWNETRLLLLVMLAGAIGSLLHALRSVYWYIGNREFRTSWIFMYALLPFGGAIIAVVFYVVIRGGFFSPRASTGEISFAGFVAFAALVGMFSQQAALKLQEIAETILTKAQSGKNAFPQQQNPTIANLTPSTVTHNTAATVKITGAGFVAGATVTVSGTPIATTYISSTELSVSIPATLLPNPGTADVVVRTDTTSSAPAHLTVT